MLVLRCVAVFLVVGGLSARTIIENKVQSDEMNVIAQLVIKSLQSSMQEEFDSTKKNSLTILEDIFRLKKLSDKSYYGLNMVAVRFNNIYYQRNLGNEFYLLNDDKIYNIEPFIEPSFFGSLSISYPEPGHLILDETVIKTKMTCDRFRVAHHLAKKIYFMGWNSTGEVNGYLYAADIRGKPKEINAEEIDIDHNVKDVAVDQFTGDIVFANDNNQIYMLQKIPFYLDIEAIAAKHEKINNDV